LAGIAGSFVSLLIGTKGAGASVAIYGLSGILLQVGSEFLPVVAPGILLGALDLGYGSVFKHPSVIVIHLAGFVVGILLGHYWKKRKSQGFTSL
jgi:hypothetical protein